MRFRDLVVALFVILKIFMTCQVIYLKYAWVIKISHYNVEDDK